ncbi:hypothetical protein ACO22_05076 [Paracoccidioides brasiliensis]|uniref:Uncharacterized protein n=1 Tax=Paracoccidioides brasiliensis TaxID=121759 RepID=A0A1D2JBA9_PARBR|nr:hypothetical protein ACO22_05076 [Paracoccidioides brasiliensis]
MSSPVEVDGGSATRTLGWLDGQTRDKNSSSMVSLGTNLPEHTPITTFGIPFDDTDILGGVDDIIAKFFASL